MTGTPSVRRRLLGAALRRYREALGYHLDDAAAILVCDRSKISRIESGQRGIRAIDLRHLLSEYGVGDEEQRALEGIACSRGARGWWQPYADALSGARLDYLIMEMAASQILTYQPQLVPELLQTPQYARAVADADPGLPPGAQDKAAEALLARQQVILGERRPELSVIIGEGALYQAVGGTGTMRDQRARLAEVISGCPQVTIQVLPLACGAPAAGSGPWTILRFAGAPGLGLVHLECLSGGICLDSQLDVACYMRAFTQLQTSALTPEASAPLFRDNDRMRTGGHDAMPQPATRLQTQPF